MRFSKVWGWAFGRGWALGRRTTVYYFTMGLWNYGVGPYVDRLGYYLTDGPLSGHMGFLLKIGLLVESAGLWKDGVGSYVEVGLYLTTLSLI